MTDKQLYAAFAAWAVTSASLMFGGVICLFAGYDTLGVCLMLPGAFLTFLPLVLP